MPQRTAADTPLCQLAFAAKAGEADALARLLSELQDTLWRFCLSQLADPDAAEEAAQETAIRLIRSIARFEGRSTAKTWALGVALNVCRERRRRRRDAALDQNETELAAGGMPLLDRLVVNEQTEAVREHLERLTDRQREAIVLRYFEQLSVDETANAMGCAAGTVKATLWQALRRLRGALQTAEGECDG